MSMSHDEVPEFSRPMAVDHLGEAAVLKEITATAEERAALACRFDLLALDRLDANLSIERLPGKGVIRVGGRFEADVTQACVVSLEPVPTHISQDFTQLYALAPETPVAREHVIDAEADDPPEALGPGGLDLGEAVVQQFALALDPYPRAPEARPPWAPDRGAPPPADAGGPFAILKALKTRD
jgi:uncharacterized metal-binding protein YceD (DUF177 family)